MRDRKLVVMREGRLQAGAALGLAGVIASAVALSSSTQTEIAGRLSFSGVALLSLALALGSARLVGVATLPVLGGALIASATANEPAWVQSIVLGCLWYVAAEFAWDAIERRDGAMRSGSFNTRRINEVATVVTLALITATAGFLLSFLAPVRTVLAVGPVMAGLLAGLIVATRHVTDSRFGARPDSSHEPTREADSTHL